MAACTKTESGRGVKQIIWEWESNATGYVVTALSGPTTNRYNGKVLGLWTIPDAVSVPTDDYDVQVFDGANIVTAVDVLCGGGIDRDDTNSEYVDGASLGCAAGHTLYLYISGAGNATKGTVVIWIR